MYSDFTIWFGEKMNGMSKDWAPEPYILQS